MGHWKWANNAATWNSSAQEDYSSRSGHIHCIRNRREELVGSRDREKGNEKANCWLDSFSLFISIKALYHTNMNTVIKNQHKNDLRAFIICFFVKGFFERVRQG